MDLDRAFQMVYKALREKAIKWNDFHKIGVDEDYYDWYYAEDELYVIKDRIFDRLTLIKAKSPKMAMDIFNEDVNAIWGIDDEEV